MKPKPIKPLKGQESVWEYPRPPKLEYVKQLLIVKHQEKTIASTSKGFRVLETSHPPVYYFPPQDVDFNQLVPSDLTTFCEFKGRGGYYHLKTENRIEENVAWYYTNPVASFAPIKDYLAFYANKVDECWVGDEKVKPQAGNFYGGWITNKIVGPFKGEPGTWGW